MHVFGYLGWALVGLITSSASEESNDYMEKIFAQILSITKLAMFVQDKSSVNETVEFYFYEKSSNEPTPITTDLPTCERFNTSLPTTFVIHGWGDHRNRKIICKLRKTILQNIDTNLVTVDWKDLAAQIYFHAAPSAAQVAVRVAELLKFLINTCEVAPKDVHLIGHSLGAQISGIAGKILGGVLGRVTGLDPAGPLYEFLYVEKPQMSLGKSSALFVDVIHTACEDFGVLEPVGHADFYPNSGILPQPGCTNFATSVSCSHVRSIEYFIESFENPLGFLAVECGSSWDWELFDGCNKDNKTFMGYYMLKSSTGSFYLRTTSEPPFAMGLLGIK